MEVFDGFKLRIMKGHENYATRDTLDTMWETTKPNFALKEKHTIA